MKKWLVEKDRRATELFCRLGRKLACKNLLAELQCTYCMTQDLEHIGTNSHVNHDEGRSQQIIMTRRTDKERPSERLYRAWFFCISATPTNKARPFTHRCWRTITNFLLVLGRSFDSPHTYSRNCYEAQRSCHLHCLRLWFVIRACCPWHLRPGFGSP